MKPTLLKLVLAVDSSRKIWEVQKCTSIIVAICEVVLDRDVNSTTDIFLKNYQALEIQVVSKASGPTPICKDAREGFEPSECK